MAKNKNKNANNANQFYTYDPNFGFIPVDNTNYQNPQYAEQANVPPYGQGQGYGNGNGYGYGNGYGRGFGYANPMQQNHMNQMNAMQEEINQLRSFITNNGQNANNMNNANAFDPAKMRELYTTIDDVAQGKAQPEKLLSLLPNASSDFWKGLAIGAGAILLYNCTPLKDVLSNLLGSGFADFMNKKEEQDENLDEDGFYIEDPE